MNVKSSTCVPVILAAPVNATPSIVKPVADVASVIAPVITASCPLVALALFRPAFGPAIVKLATEIVKASLYVPGSKIILSPAFAAAKASAIVAYKYSSSPAPT